LPAVPAFAQLSGSDYTTMKTKTLARIGALAALALATARPTPAQTPPPPAGETVRLEAFTVTGSNIKGVDTEKTLPVTVITAEDIAVSGISTMTELVETLPYSTNVSINETATGPNDARGDVSSINLRNLGAGRTLVLLNGRRLSAYGVTPGTPPVQFVNVNAIPFGAVEQVEVLRDGASAIYGSDAIGGVVNTILKKSFNGFEVSGRYAFASDGGSPRETTVTLAGGRAFNANRSNLTLVYSYYHRDLLMAPERDYAGNADKRLLVDAPFNTNANFNNLNSSAQFGRFTAVNDAGTAVSVPGITAANGQFFYDPNTGVRSTGAGPTGFYNSQAGTQLLPTIDRHNVFGTFDHKFTPSVALFSELSYYDSKSFGQFDASPISQATDGVVIPRTNYYNPVGTRFFGPGTANPTGTPANVVIRNYRTVDLGARSYDTDSESYRLLAGLRGDIAGTNWSWETAGMFMRGETFQVNHGYISQSRLATALARATPDAYNPFGGENPASVLQSFAIDIWDRGVGTLSSFDAKASGEIFKLPGGAVSLAIGGEYRREAMKQRNDPFGLADDVIAQSEQLDVTASRHVYGGFAEVLVPLIGETNRMPFTQALELRVAGRHERYQEFSATKPGVGLSWRPLTWLLLRGSYNEGFRAPTVVELFTPAIGRRNDGIVDPARPGQPDAAGSVSKRIVTGGNANLRPEESESFNFGVVVDVPFVKGLSLGADVFRIKQFNQIDNSSAVDELNLDAQLWRAGGGSNPRVLRAARTAADTAANLPGVLVEVLSTFQNLSLREVRGTDLFLNYRTPRWSFGRFSFTSAVSYIDQLFSVNQQGTRTELVRNNGNPRTKATAGISWSHGKWSASVFERWTSDYRAPVAYTTLGIPFIIDDYWVTNASVGYSFREGRMKGLRVRLGVNNVFDEDPPLYPINSSGYHPSYADPRGRMPYVDVTYRF
jgi:iron complex outermembrane receptor protein